MPLLLWLKNEIMDLLFPRCCVGCQADGALLCACCKETLRALPPSCFVCKKFSFAAGRNPAGKTCRACYKKTAISFFLSPFFYGDPLIKALIHGLKYRRLREIAEILASFLADYLRKNFLPDDTVIVPIPLYVRRERVRGFNQATLLAEALGHMLALSVSPLLIQTKKKMPQATLVAALRRKNIQGIFAVQKGMYIPKRVMLLDDVKTTGATLEEAALVLKKAGAKQVWAVTVARS